MTAQSSERPVRSQRVRPLPKKERTRDALIETCIRLIGQKGIGAVSVVDITNAMGISNGSFYYHFQNKDELLETVGHAVVARLSQQIDSVTETDPAVRIARGPLIILRFVADHPELCAILLRVIEDPERSHKDLSDPLKRDVVYGAKKGVFLIDDVDLAVAFCRGIVGVAVRAKLEGNDNILLDALTAIQTLTMLGVPVDQARTVVEQERVVLAVGQSDGFP